MQLRFARQPRSLGFVVLRREFDAAGERTQVESGAAHHDCAPAARADVANGGERVACITRGRIAFARIEKPDEMMRHGRKRLGRRGRGSDGHAAIDLPRIGADDLGIERSRQLDRKLRLAAGRRAGENQDAVRHA